MKLIIEIGLDDVKIPAEADEVIVRVGPTDIQVRMPSVPEYPESLVEIVVTAYVYERYRESQGDWSVRGIADRANQLLVSRGKDRVTAHLVGHILRSQGFETERSSLFGGRYVPVFTQNVKTWERVWPHYHELMTAFGALDEDSAEVLDEA
jgi:hypothetical protein